MFSRFSIIGACEWIHAFYSARDHASKILTHTLISTDLNKILINRNLLKINMLKITPNS